MASHPRQRLLFEAFNQAIEHISKNKTAQGLFAQLRQAGFNKMELMVIDSGVKKMPLDDLWRTLLLSRREYLRLLEGATVKLVNLVYSETPKEDGVYYIEENQ